MTTNAIATAPVTEIFNGDNMRTVKITTLRDAPEGTQFYAELHDECGTVRKVLGSEFNTDKPVKAWEGDDGATVFIEGRGTVSFIAHKFSGPKYPVTRIQNDKTGNDRNIRVTFKVATNAATTPTETDILEPVNITPVEPELVIEQPAQMTKPVKSDYDNFGEYMRACKQFKQWQREQEQTTELTVV